MNYVPEEFAERLDTAESAYEWRLMVAELHQYMLDLSEDVNKKWKHPLKWLNVP